MSSPPQANTKNILFEEFVYAQPMTVNDRSQQVFNLNIVAKICTNNLFQKSLKNKISNYQLKNQLLMHNQRNSTLGLKNRGTGYETNKKNDTQKKVI